LPKACGLPDRSRVLDVAVVGGVVRGLHVSVRGGLGLRIRPLRHLQR
jgi:hypothetical protein